MYLTIAKERKSVAANNSISYFRWNIEFLLHYQCQMQDHVLI